MENFMTQTAKKKPAAPQSNKFKPKKRRSSRTAMIFWICLVLVAAPLIILGWILFSSAMNTHKPVLGDRYKDDLNPAIKSEQMKEVKTKSEGVEGVQSVDVEMATATLRVYVDVADDATAETATATADSVYKAVAEVLDPSVYFTKTDSEKMYDLEIHVYTEAERKNTEGENFVYVIETKTSSMDAPASEIVSTAKDAALAQQLRDDVTARKAAAASTAAATDGGTITVGGNEVQATEAPAE
jgi:copper chaperone CopZ